MKHELLKIAEVEKLVQLTESTVYRLVRAREFPAPLKIGRRNVRWRRSEIEAWLASRPRATGENQAA